MNYTVKLETVTDDGIIMDRVEQFRVPFGPGFTILLDDKAKFDVLVTMVEPHSDVFAAAVMLNREPEDEEYDWKGWKVRVEGEKGRKAKRKPKEIPPTDDGRGAVGNEVFRAMLEPFGTHGVATIPHTGHTTCVVCGGTSPHPAVAPWTCHECR